MNEIVTSSVIVDLRATALTSAGVDLGGQALSPTDGESTISANQNAQNAFQDAQQGHVLFGGALDASSAMIRKIGDAFVTVDTHSAGRFGAHAVM